MPDQMNYSITQTQSMSTHEQKDMETLLNTFIEEIGSQQDQNFLQDNVVPKKRLKEEETVVTQKLKPVIYWQTFLTEDLNNLILKRSFIIDILSFLLQNINPINLERKVDSKKDRDMVKFLWDECVTHDFVRYLYKIENCVIISKPNLTYQKANDIVKKFLKEDANRINLLKYKVKEKFKLIHYIYSLLFRKIYNRTSRFGIQNKTTFDFYFQTWKSRKQMVQQQQEL